MGRVTVPSLLSEFTIAPPALTPVERAVEIEGQLRASLAEAPNDARTAAHLANLLVRGNRYLEALELYERATQADPSFAQAWLAAGDLAFVLRDESLAQAYIDRALALERYYPDPNPEPRPLHLVMLMRDAPYSVNAPLEMLLDRSQVRIDRCYVKGAGFAKEAGAAYLTAFGYWSEADATVSAASRHANLNDPQALVRCCRERLSTTLDDVPRVRAAPWQLLPKERLGSIELPALLRPPDTHAGRGFTNATTRDELSVHVERFPASNYYVGKYIEYRNPDGNYRKYRIVIIDGDAYPYHLAISPRWIVHYQSSPMSEHDWMRSEELTFLRDPCSVFPHWHAQTGAVARAIGLDYVGLDVTRLADGTMLVFEADPAMLIHDEAEAGIFAYKRPYVGRIRKALMNLIASRCNS